MNFELELFDENVDKLKFRIGIFNIEYRLIAEVDSDQTEFVYKKTSSNNINVSVKISGLYLRYGKYSLHLHVINADTNKKILRQSEIASFIVKQTISIGADFLLPSEWIKMK